MSFHQTRVNWSSSLPASSRAWIARQSRDPYVRQRNTHPAAFRARSAFKLLEIDDKFGGFLKHKNVRAVVDLGAAPGGWSQVVASKLGWMEEFDRGSDKNSGRHVPKTRTAASNSNHKEWGGINDSVLIDDGGKLPNRKGQGVIVAVDLLPIMPIPGVHTLKADFLLPESIVSIQELLACQDNLDGKADIILSDMAANVSGIRIRDAESSLVIAESVFGFAAKTLRTGENIFGGTLLLKHFTHPLLQQFRIENLEPNFHNVRYIKPDASRTASSEGYWLCQGWKGLGPTPAAG